MRLLKALLVLTLVANGATASELTGTLQKIKETNRIAIGFQEGSIPFSYLDANQRPVGYSIDVCQKIVDAVKKELNLPNLEVAYTPLTAANRIPLLMNGTVDMHCSSATNNADRQRQIAFTNTYFVTANRFLSKRAANIRKLEDLKGKTLVSVAGSTNIAAISKINTERNLGINIIGAKDQLEAFMMLESDRAQAYVLDDVQLAVAAARSKNPSAYVVSEEAFNKPEPVGIMIRKDDLQFKALADRVTATLYQSPEIDAIYKKWFQSPVPPSGVNFNYPMPTGLRNAFQKPSSSSDPDVYAHL